MLYTLYIVMFYTVYQAYSITRYVIHHMLCLTPYTILYSTHYTMYFIHYTTHCAIYIIHLYSTLYYIGKTLTFALPLIMFALEEEIKLPLQAGKARYIYILSTHIYLLHTLYIYAYYTGYVSTYPIYVTFNSNSNPYPLPLFAGEGPIGLILCPSRELAKQTYEVVEYYTQALKNGGFPEIRVTLCIGGENKRTQIDTVSKKGVHCIVATPGRLKDLLQEGHFNLDLCKYLTLDEGDRM